MYGVAVIPSPLPPARPFHHPQLSADEGSVFARVSMERAGGLLVTGRSLSFPDNKEKMDELRCLTCCWREKTTQPSRTNYSGCNHSSSGTRRLEHPNRGLLDDSQPCPQQKEALAD